MALFRETGLTHLYTIEANYNAARVLNLVPPASGKHNGRASPPNTRRISPRFTADVLQAGGRALLVGGPGWGLPGPPGWLGGPRMPRWPHSTLATVCLHICCGCPCGILVVFVCACLQWPQRV